MAKMSRSSRRRVDNMMQRLENISLNLDKISQDTVEDLITRAAISSVPDGFGSNSRLGDGSRGSSDITPTEASVFARERPPKDELNQRVKHIEKLMTFLDVAAGEIQSNIGEIYRVEEEKKQRAVSTPCLICDVNPAEKAGYCKPDYDKWFDYGSPDRLRWEMFCKQTRTLDDILFVPECPPPGARKTARRGPWRKKSADQNLTNADLDVY